MKAPYTAPDPTAPDFLSYNQRYLPENHPTRTVAMIYADYDRVLEQKQENNDCTDAGCALTFIQNFVSTTEKQLQDSVDAEETKDYPEDTVSDQDSVSSFTDSD